MSSQLTKLRADMKRLADPMRAKISQSFFKTGPGQYGEGDKFIGLTVPAQRKLAKQYHTLPTQDILALLHNPIHEERLIALILLVDRFQKGDEKVKQDTFDLYLSQTKSINNWDLVDSSAQYIVGAFLFQKPIKTQLTLAKSKHLWERRIAIISTFYDIYQGSCDKTIKVSKQLLHDKHDLIHKAVGWMLREVGKRCSQKELISFLNEHAFEMPRTMLRYAIERFPKEMREKYLKQKIA